MTGYEKYSNLRDKMKLTDTKVAELTGISRSTFSDWASGRSKPGAVKRDILARFFNVSLMELSDDSESIAPSAFKIDANVAESLCLQQGISLKELATNIKMDGYDFIEWKSGRYEPNYIEIKAMAEYLGTTIEQLQQAQMLSTESKSTSKSAVLVEETKKGLYSLADKVPDEKVIEAMQALAKIIGEE